MKYILSILFITTLFSCPKNHDEDDNCGTVFEKRPTTYGCIVVVHYPDGSSKEFFKYMNDIVKCNAIKEGDRWCETE